MRIKKLKVKNIYADKAKWDISLTEKENIILIRQPNDENAFIPFGLDFFEIIECIFFKDSYEYIKNMLSKKALIECTVERQGIEYTFGFKGNCMKQTKDGRVYMKHALDWFCAIPEGALQGENGGWLGAQLCCDAKEYFYPNVLEEFARFDKNTYAEAPANFVYGEEFVWLKRMAKYNKREVALEQKLQAIINEFTAIKLDEHISVGLDEKGEYALLFDGKTVPDKELSEQEELWINFCGWSNNLRILKQLCDFVGEEGEFPVFIDREANGIWKKYERVFIEELKKTGRQVFICLAERDERIEKYCDYVRSFL